MKNIFAICTMLSLLLSCAVQSGGVSAKDIAAKTYVLQSVNGVEFAGKERTPEIQFNETLWVTGQVCNRFMGQGTLQGDVLTVPEMASTMMFCADPQLNDMEREFASLLRQGAKVSLRGNALSLSNGTTTYRYNAR